MTSKPKKTWLRPTQITKQFPKVKYEFTKHLKNVGDYVETYAMPLEDIKRMEWAADFWAYYHDVTIKLTRLKVPDGMALRVQLIKKVRVRDYS